MGSGEVTHEFSGSIKNQSSLILSCYLARRTQYYIIFL